MTVAVIIKVENSKKNWQNQKVGIWLNTKKLLKIVLQELDQVFWPPLLRKLLTNYD